ncbi:hypothetical protein, partial [Malikia sp.]|uniref:hypothetical protein n=1 Tax=Malikia sp. TaxID=2070706 RepID=UPI002601E7A9
SRLPIRFPRTHDAAPAALGRIRTDGGPKQGHGSKNFSGLTYVPSGSGGAVQSGQAKSPSGINMGVVLSLLVTALDYTLFVESGN